MSQNVYEGLFILDSNKYASDPSGCAAEVAKIVESNDGELLASRLWEDRRLAYPIDGHKKGAYWLTYIRVDGKQVPAIERSAQLSEIVIRSLVIKLDPRIVDVLVSHAQGQVAEGEDEGEAEGEPAEAEESFK